MSYLLETLDFNPERLGLEESLFHTANGYLGVRACFEEGSPDGSGGGVRGTYINGFHDTHAIEHPERLFGFPEIGERILNVTDVQGISLRVDGEDFRLSRESVSAYSRRLDMRSGQACRDVTWTAPSGRQVTLSVRRLVSFQRPEVFAIEYRLTAADDVFIEIESTVIGDVRNYFNPADPRVSGQAFASLEVVNSEIRGSRAAITSRTLGTGLELNVQVDHRIVRDRGIFGVPAAVQEGSRVCFTWSAELAKGESCVLEKIAVFRDSVRHPDAGNRRGDYWRGTQVPVFADMAGEQRKYLEGFWDKAGIDIEGDEEALRGLRFNLYHLLQSASPHPAAGIPAKGLSGEGYEGHYFWDTEIFMLPFFLYTRPLQARNLLVYRHSTLPEARKNALILGHRKGAAFPWRTITGRECSAYYPSGSAQYHINADIAYAVRRYWEATGDDRFMLDYGAEILFETARIWMEIGNHTADGFHINSVTGPDEYTCLVNDNYYTNRMAGVNLESAVQTYDFMKTGHPEILERLGVSLQLESGERDDWERAALKMVIPYDAAADMNPQDESFFRKPVWDIVRTPPNRFPLLLHYHHMTLSRFQVCKQADTVLAYVLLDPCRADSTSRNSFAYYEKLTTHDSSLSYGAFAIMACRLGELEKAYSYLLKTAVLDLQDTHGNTRDGIHAAGMGGSWLALVWGFGGFRPKGAVPAFEPRLPAKWTSLRFCITWRGSTFEIVIRRDRISLSLVDGPALAAEVYGTPVLLAEGRTPSVPYQEAPC